MAYNVHKVVRVLCQSKLRESQATRTTSLTLKAMQERDLCSQGSYGGNVVFIRVHFFFCQHLTNWARWTKRKKVWSSAKSLFKYRFRSRHRLRYLSSLWKGTGQTITRTSVGIIKSHYLRKSRIARHSSKIRIFLIFSQNIPFSGLIWGKIVLGSNDSF